MHDNLESEASRHDASDAFERQMLKSMNTARWALGVLVVCIALIAWVFA